MRYSTVCLGGHEFQMPSVTLGSVFFGTNVTRQAAFEILDYYYGQGGTWLDTARVYCTGLIVPDKRKADFEDSEEVIGRWVAQRGLRGAVTVITKGAHWSLETHQKRVNAKDIRTDINTSLQKLKMDYVDVYFLHNDDPTVPVEDIMPVMDALVKEGKARVIGCSNWKIGRVRQANEFAVKNGLTPFAISQVKWSYAAPTPAAPAGSVNMEGEGEGEGEEYAGYRQLSMPVMAYSSQARGFFLKTAKNGFEANAIGSAAVFLSPQNIQRAKAVMEISRAEHISVSAAAFSYLWSRDIPVTALVGPATAAQLAESLADCDYFPLPGVKSVLEQAQCDF